MTLRLVYQYGLATAHQYFGVNRFLDTHSIHIAATLPTSSQHLAIHFPSSSISQASICIACVSILAIWTRQSSGSPRYWSRRRIGAANVEQHCRAFSNLRFESLAWGNAHPQHGRKSEYTIVSLLIPTSLPIMARVAQFFLCPPLILHAPESRVVQRLGPSSRRQ